MTNILRVESSIKGEAAVSWRLADRIVAHLVAANPDAVVATRDLARWIDQLARKGETFRYTDAGPEGLLRGKRAIVAYTSDGTRFGSDIDFASGYLRHILGFFGIADVAFVAVAAMAFGAEDGIERGEAQVDALAA